MLVVRVLIFSVLVPGTVVVVVPCAVLLSDLALPLGVPAPVRLLGLLLVAAGVATYVWCAWDFGASGRGTPAPYDPPQLLVTRGLYAWVRNPIYIGIVTILCGEGLLFDALTLMIYGAVLLVLFHLRVVLFEEPRLRRRFGAAYEEYCGAVPRWLPGAGAFKRAI